jgi:type II secretory pathway component GspD/PulD (secretin)
MILFIRATAWRWALVVGLAAIPATRSHAQEQAVDVEAQAQPAATAVAPAKAAEAKPAEAKPAAKPGENKPAEGKPDKAGEAAKKDKAPEPVRRPLEPKTAPDPRELEVRPSDDGLVSFSFKGQGWPDVLEWLAGISGLNLHWEEVPPGYLDLTTRGKYTPAEARDLINSVLLAKGYTLLVNGEILVVANLKTLDVSLVPRVPPHELEARGKYEIAKTFFDLDWLMAETVAEEIKPALSPHGKVIAMKSTNRLDVLDTVGNLRRIRDVLTEEQSSNTQGRLVRQFKLKHTRAAEVLETLNTLLGIKPKPSTENLTPQQMQMQQQAMMMAQQQAQQRGAQPVAAAKSEPQVYLAINARENSLLANAPPDKMAVIEQAVMAVDVPVERADALLGNVPRLRIYRLTGMAPETLVKVLEDIGGLDPTSRLEVDGKNKAVIAFAPLVDHVMIQSLVERLDGTGRTFEVIQLRVLKAENVAGSIDLLMRGPQENTSSRSRYPYYIYDYGYGSSQSTDKADRFQVDADIEHNRLLLRATEAELAEVRQLLAKLGELPDDARGGPRVRIVPAAPGEETQRLLERLKRVWPSVGPNALDVEEEPKAPPPVKDQPDARQPDRQLPPLRATASGGRKPPAAFPTPLALNDPEAEPAPQSPLLPREPVESFPLEYAQQAPPIRITIGPQGLILSSPDTRALDQIEDLLAEISPAKSSFRIFRLQHTYAKDVATLLEDIFKDEDSTKKSRTSELFETMYFGFSSNSSTPKTRSSLSKRKPLAFVPDPVTNTILVQNADDAQLAEIDELIQLYDRVEPPDSNSVRRTQIIAVRYAIAKQVADVIKDVYRDLLSPNDKALQQANANKQQQQQQERPMSFYSYLAAASQEENEDKNLPRFKGLLSVGVDELTNTLVVSAPQGLLTDVAAMIEQLDRSAQPLRPVVTVLRLQSSGTSAYLKGGAAPNGRRLSPGREPANGAAAGQPQPVRTNGQQE